MEPPHMNEEASSGSKMDPDEVKAYCCCCFFCVGILFLIIGMSTNWFRGDEQQAYYTYGGSCYGAQANCTGAQRIAGTNRYYSGTYMIFMGYYYRGTGTGYSSGYSSYRGSYCGSRGGSSCFGENTQILMANNITKSIEDINLGETLYLGGKVSGTMQFISEILYDYEGITVDGIHPVYE